MAIKRIDTELTHNIGKIDHDPIVGNFAVINFPEVHIANFDPLAGRRNAHKFASMHSLLAAESGCPFTLDNARFINANLVGKRCLKRTLPVILELFQPLLEATTSIAHPPKTFVKKGANTVNFVIV